MERFSNGAILKWSNSQMEQFSNGAILKSNISQMEHFSNEAILKWSNSQIELDDSLVGQLTRSLLWPIVPSRLWPRSINNVIVNVNDLHMNDKVVKFG